MCNPKLTRRDFLKVSALGAAGAGTDAVGSGSRPEIREKKSSANDTIGNPASSVSAQRAMHLLGGLTLRSTASACWQDATSTTSNEPASRSA